MNKLKPETQAAVLNGLCEGASIRSVERLTGVHRDTITRLLLRVGEACDTLLDERMRDLTCERIEIDELWGYVLKKDAHMLRSDDPLAMGSFWVWLSLDSDSKLIPNYAVGKRDIATAKAFVADLAGRMANRIQLSSDGLTHYISAVEEAFGADVDYSQIVKAYEGDASGRYSPPKFVDVTKYVMRGNPDLDKASTSFIERQNLTARMHVRRLTRLTNGFSRKVENLKASIALYVTWYNFVKYHRTVKTTPAVAAGVVDRRWTIYDLVDQVGW